jgi:hypothetical protein
MVEEQAQDQIDNFKIESTSYQIVKKVKVSHWVGWLSERIEGRDSSMRHDGCLFWLDRYPNGVNDPYPISLNPGLIAEWEFLKTLINGARDEGVSLLILVY